MASSTTTSSTSSSSDDTQSMDTESQSSSPSKPSLKRSREEQEISQAQDEFDLSKENQQEQNEGEPKQKKRRLLRRLETKPLEGFVLNITGVPQKIVENILGEFKDPELLKPFPDAKCCQIETSLLKRLPTEKEKKEFAQESKRLAQKRALEEGRLPKVKTEEEKRIARERANNPKYQIRKKEMARIKSELIQKNEELKRQYKEEVEKRLGKLEKPVRKPRKKAEGKENVKPAESK
ncbi:MAG TPA: hypothetical protein VFP45_03435 [Candidatus Nitrosotalea sp.]|nr:hypothetical protein [Candidatus Nitrosotalea sp.]